MEVTATAELKFNFSGEVRNDNESIIEFWPHNTGEDSQHFLIGISDDWKLSVEDQKILLEETGAIRLFIPSGELFFEVDRIEAEIDEYGDSSFVFTGAGSWTGKLAGLEGGLSGVCSFSAEPHYVTGGTYLLNGEEYLPIGEYRERIALHRFWTGHELALAQAKAAHETRRGRQDFEFTMKKLLSIPKATVVTIQNRRTCQPPESPESPSRDAQFHRGYLALDFESAIGLNNSYGRSANTQAVYLKTTYADGRVPLTTTVELSREDWSAQNPETAVVVDIFENYDDVDYLQ